MAIIYKLAPGEHGLVVLEEGQTTAKVFAELLDAGWSMYDLSDPHDGKLLKEFDPAARLIIATPWRSQ